MRVIVEHPLNAHFVDMGEGTEIHESFEHDGVQVVVSARVPDGNTFAVIVCSGSYESDFASLPATADPEPAERDRVLLDGRFIAQGPLTSQTVTEFSRVFTRIEQALEHVGEAIRWRFNLAGKDPVFGGTLAYLFLDTQRIELHPLGVVSMGDDRADLTESGLREIVGMLQAAVATPLAHQLLREAWNLHWTNSRSSLVIGVAAAEVGIKQHIARLLPETQWLLEEIPSPPLDKIMHDFLPKLPARVDVDPSRRCPQHMRKVIKAAVEDRNRVSHRGVAPTVPLRSTLESIREFLYLLDFYEGSEWAKAHLSNRTLAELALEGNQSL